MQFELRRLNLGDEEAVPPPRVHFQTPPQRGGAPRLLPDPRPHPLVAYDGASRPLGFVSGVEVTHPDKGTEMFLYELAVDEPVRRRGIGRALVEALATVARERGCYGMFTLADDDNGAARAAYASAGGRE